MRGRWTTADDARLTVLWGQSVKSADIAAEFGCTTRLLNYHAARLGLGPKTLAPIASAADDARLKTMWAAGIPNRDIGDALSIGPKAVGRRAKRMGLPSREPHGPSAEDDARFAKMRAAGMSFRAIGKAFGLSSGGAKKRAKRLGLPKPVTAAKIKPPRISPPRTWTPERNATLIRMRDAGATRQEIADEIGVTGRAVHARIKALKLPNISPWTDAKDATLREMWPGETVVDISRATGVSRQAVVRRAEALGLPARPVKPRRVVGGEFVAPRDERELHDSPVAAELLDAKLQRAIESLRNGKDPIGIACGLNIPLREVYRLRGEMRAA